MSLHTCRRWCRLSSVSAPLNTTRVRRQLHLWPAEVYPGSALGPWLWNLAYNHILSTLIPSVVRSLCYADNLMLYVYARISETTVSTMTSALTSISQWLSNHRLEMAVQKSGPLVVARRRNINKPSLILLQCTEVT